MINNIIQVHYFTNALNSSGLKNTLQDTSNIQNSQIFSASSLKRKKRSWRHYKKIIPQTRVERKKQHKRIIKKANLIKLKCKRF